MRVLVDDQLALLANLGVLELPPDVDLPLLTVYSFQLRIASAVVVERATDGVLQRLVSTYLPDGIDPRTLVDRASRLVRVMDPTVYGVAVAEVKVRMKCNLLTAEVIAVAQQEEAEARLVPSNAKGQLWEALESAAVPRAVWEIIAGEDSLMIQERPAVQ